MSEGGSVRTVATPLGFLRLEAGPAGLVRFRWRGPSDGDPSGASAVLLDRAESAVLGYLRDPQREWPPLPLAPVHSTPFQRRVWRAIRCIPPGQTRTYGEVAARTGGGARAVGSAAGANPWPILVPCHRVVGRLGLGGYMGLTEGEGPAIKDWLLHHEGAEIPRSRGEGPGLGPPC